MGEEKSAGLAGGKAQHLAGLPREEPGGRSGMAENPPYREQRFPAGIDETLTEMGMVAGSGSVSRGLLRSDHSRRQEGGGGRAGRPAPAEAIRPG